MRRQYKSLSASEKDGILLRLEAHTAAGELIWSPRPRQFYWDGERGDMVGCMTHSSDLTEFERLLGIPSVCGYMGTAIFDGLPEELGAAWPQRFLRAVPTEADLFPLCFRMFHRILTKPRTGLVELAAGDAEMVSALSAVAELSGTEADELRWQAWSQALQKCETAQHNNHQRKYSEPPLVAFRAILEAAAYMASYGIACNFSADKVPNRDRVGNRALHALNATAYVSGAIAQAIAIATCQSAIKTALGLVNFFDRSQPIVADEQSVLLLSRENRTAYDIARSYGYTMEGVYQLALQASHAAGLQSSYANSSSKRAAAQVADPLLKAIEHAIVENVGIVAQQHVFMTLADDLIEIMEAIGNSQ